MLFYKQVLPLQAFLNGQSGATTGFVPTMGALHEGHLSLVRRAKAENDFVLCSVFVNPTQFNEESDLEKYPRTPSKDRALLEKVGCDLLFMPSVEEVYPSGLDSTLDLDFGHLDQVMEGAFRPGHFQGVATVVKRLLDITAPDKLYLGQKDYQQVAIVGHMIRQLHLPVELVSCPIIREADGLAMSSRNRRLSPAGRKKAPAIYQTLQWAASRFAEVPPQDLARQGKERLAAAGLRPEYFEIVDGHSLLPVDRAEEAEKVVACTAAWAGEVRLIDNLILKA